jgi:hypothetical protein
LRPVKWHDEDPCWPTAVPLAPDGRPLSDRDREIDGKLVERGRNIAKEVIDEAHAEGLNVAVYYWHVSEGALEALHGSWICRDPDGNPIPGPGIRGTHLDITGAFREAVLTRLRELAALGVDGFYFDYEHLPPDGCWGSALAELWEAATGRPAPAADDDDPLYRQFLDFKAEKIEDTFTYWRDKVKSEHPDVVFVISTSTVRR